MSDLEERVRRLLLGHAPFAYCDACLALHFEVSLADARGAAVAVAGAAGYQRGTGECSSCHRTAELTQPA
jgi:mono/diheme cytochrome c family protein